jgi:hypothetical protein
MPLEVAAIAVGVVSVAVSAFALWQARKVEVQAQERLRHLRLLVTPFDHDGDGKPGGSKPR